MKLIQSLSLAVAAMVLVSCLGKSGTEEIALRATPAPKPVPKADPRPDRAPPPPQPQDGSMIVTPGGTENVAVPKVSEKDKNNAIEAAEREITRRKENAAEADDMVSKALKNIDDDDLDKAFTELKKAVDKYPATSGGE